MSAPTRLELVVQYPPPYSVAKFVKLMGRFGHCSKERLFIFFFHLPGNVQCLFTDQLYTDDLVVVADSPQNLQTALNAAHQWGATKSTVIVFGP